MSSIGNNPIRGHVTIPAAHKDHSADAPIEPAHRSGSEKLSADHVLLSLQVGVTPAVPRPAAPHLGLATR